MRNLKIILFVILPISIFVIGCSEKESVDDPDTSTTIPPTPPISISCSSEVNFGDLVVETSWDTENISKKDTYNACSIDDESWMDKYNNGVVMMKCLKEDGHRTELKENVGNESALSTYRQMMFTAKYTSIAENGLTIAQIHNRGADVKRPWFRVYIDDDLYIKVKETETTPTESSSEYTTYTGPKYTSGQDISITITTGVDGKEEAIVGIETVEENWSQLLSPNSSWSTKSTSYYLKAGVYTEGNDTTPIVEYSSFSINY